MPVPLSPQRAGSLDLLRGRYLRPVLVTQSDQVRRDKHIPPEQKTKQNTLKKYIKMQLKTRLW